MLPTQHSQQYADREAVMATKRVTPAKKTTSRKAATALPELTESSVTAVRESAQTVKPASNHIDPEARRQLVAAEAYFIAERRGFAAGNELADWVAAEALVDSRLQQAQNSRRRPRKKAVRATTDQGTTITAGK